MKELILFAMATGGLTWIVTASQIFFPFRKRLAQKNMFFHGLFTCSGCFGFYAGMAVWGMFQVAPYSNFIIFALAGSFIGRMTLLIIQKK